MTQKKNMKQEQERKTSVAEKMEFSISNHFHCLFPFRHVVVIAHKHLELELELEAICQIKEYRLNDHSIYLINESLKKNDK